jgi:glucuronokinase
MANYRAEVIAYNSGNSDICEENKICGDGGSKKSPQRQRVRFIPHPRFDPHEFGSLQSLRDTSRREGYYGGLRLLQATCTRFFELYRDWWNKIRQEHRPEGEEAGEGGKESSREVHPLPTAPDSLRGFTMRYDTTIPLQVGLAGSSAIIVATFRCLCAYFSVHPEQLSPWHLWPQIVLDVERLELGIAAGLQDRVIQIYGGLVMMDFETEALQKRGFGGYQTLDPAVLPGELFLAYWPTKPSMSGKVHSNLRRRWEEGEPQVLQAMQTFRQLTDETYALLIKRQELLEGAEERGEECDNNSSSNSHECSEDYSDISSPEQRILFQIARNMNKNFNTRLQILGPGGVGPENVFMVTIARSLGLACKFTGSGGAIVCLRYPEGRYSKSQALKNRLTLQENYNIALPVGAVEEEPTFDAMKAAFAANGICFERIIPM